MHVSDVRNALEKVLNKPYMAERLFLRLQELWGSDLSVEGYLKWLVKKYGESAAYPNVLLSQKCISEYASSVESVCGMFPMSVLDTADRLVSLIDVFGIQNLDIILDRLKGSADDPAIYMALWIVKEDIDRPELYSMLDSLRPAAKKFFEEYINAPDKLPEAMKQHAMEVRGGNT